MSNAMFNDLIQGKQVQLNETQLAQFQIYCSAQNLSLEKWNEISLNLFKQKREYCIHFLQYVQKNEITKPTYNDFIHQDNKMRIYNNLFALYLTKATKQQIRPQSDLSEAIRYLTQGQNVKVIQNILGRAFLDYFDGELTKATNMFNNSIKNSQMGNTSTEDKFIAMIGLAQVSFLKKNYAKALELYRSALSTFKSLPVKARIGMAYCYFYMEKYEMARACFTRILNLKSDCIQAYIGLAVIEAKNQNFGQYFKQLSKAVKINKKHPLVLIHLAEHYLIKGDLQKSTKSAQEGLQEVEKMAKFFVKPNKTPEQSIRNDYIQLKARFNNILGQVQHKKNNFLDALKYYRLASNQNLAFNEIYLSQVYTNQVCQNYAEGLKILQKLFKQSSPAAVKFYNQSLKDLAYLKSKNPSVASQQKNCEDYYNEAIAYNKNDVEVKIELSNQITQTKKSKSLKLLLTVYKILQNQGIESIKPQLMNNIGVLYLENHEYQEACHFLQHCVQRLQVINQRISEKKNNSLQTENCNQNGLNEGNMSSEDALEQQSIKINANYLIALFNLAITKEKLCYFVEAIGLYEKIIGSNKYFIDAHIRLGYVYFIQGNFNKAISVLESALKTSEQNQTKFIRFDKVLSMKLAILKLWGDQVRAKDLARQITKTTRDVYTQIYELSLQYEQLLKRQPELVVIKDFLRPNREIYMRLCHDDPSNAFGYLVLCILLLTDKRISMKQGSQLFTQLKQHSSQEIPIVLYNMGLFFLNYDDYQKSKFIFKLYKEKTNDERGQQLCALSNILQGNYPSSIQNIKKNILMNPTNIKYRYQLFYANQKKVEQERVDDKSKLRSLISPHLQTLKKCHKFYNFFSKFNPNDYSKYYESPDLKEQTRNYGQKIRTLCDERKFYVGSNIDYYEKLQKDQLIRQREEQERQRRIKLSNQLQFNEQQKVQASVIQENNHFDQSDSEEIRKRKREERKKKALELARKKDQQINQKLGEMKEAERQENQKKMARSRNKQPKEKGVRKRQKKVKAADSQQQQIQYESDDRSFIEQPSHESASGASYQQQNEDVEAPKRKRRQERRQERREKRKKIKKQRMAVRLSDDEDISANPFEDTPQESKKEEESEEQFERKKKKKEEKPQQEDMDLEKYLLG